MANNDKPRQGHGGSSNLVLKNLQAFLTCKRLNPNYASATAAAAGTLLSLSLVNQGGTNNSNSNSSSSNVESTATIHKQSSTSKTLDLSSSSSRHENIHNVTNKNKVDIGSPKNIKSVVPSPKKIIRTNSASPGSSSSSGGSQNNGGNPSSSSNSSGGINDECKRFRSANYSALEKEIFVKAMTPYKHILEDKRVDSDTLLEKATAWRSIVTAFNSHNGVVRRDRKQLKELWKRIKDRDRRSRSGSKISPVVTTSKPPTTTTPTIINITSTPINLAQDTPSTSKLMKFALLANAAAAENSLTKDSIENLNDQSGGIMVDENNSNSNKLQYAIPVGLCGGQIRLHADAETFPAGGIEIKEADNNEVDFAKAVAKKVGQVYARRTIANAGSIVEPITSTDVDASGIVKHSINQQPMIQPFAILTTDNDKIKSSPLLATPTTTTMTVTSSEGQSSVSGQQVIAQNFRVFKRLPEPPLQHTPGNTNYTIIFIIFYLKYLSVLHMNYRSR